METKKQSSWQKYFYGKNLFINFLMIAIPASLTIGILREINFSGVLITVGVLYGFIYLIGSIREHSLTKKDTLKNISLLYIVYFIILIIFISTYSKETSEEKNIVNDTVTDKSKKFSEIDKNLYRNTKYNFRIKFPEGWDIKSGDGLNMIQKATKGNSSINIGVREFPTIEDMDTTNYSIKDITSLSEYKDDFIKDMKEKNSSVKLLDSGETKLDNIDTYWIKYSITYSTLDITVHGTVIVYQLLHKNIFYTISAGTVSDEFADTENELKKSVSTFVIEDFY